MIDRAARSRLLAGIAPTALIALAATALPGAAQAQTDPTGQTAPATPATPPTQTKAAPQTQIDPAPPTTAAEPDRGDVVVTGSYIAKPVQDQASPVSLIGSAEIQSRGIQSVEGLLSTLPSNGLSKRYNDATGSPYTAGTSQVNLRGLGFSSTLTLINGRRQTLAPTPDTDGASFVDINPIPLVMIERLEVLTDGASAIYGSDAIAGVANFIMRKRMNGVEVRGSFGATTKSFQSDTNVGIVGGFTLDRLNMVAGIEYIHRSRLGQTERDFSAPFAISGFGSPGAFQPVGGTAAQRVRDPNCTALGGIASVGNLCSIYLSPYFDLVPREDRVASYMTMTYDVGGGLEAYGEGSYAYSDVHVRASPSYLNAKFPIVPANNPGNLVVNGGLGVPVYYFGRPFGSRFPATQRPQTIETVRGVAGLRGNLTADWRFDTSFSYSHQRSYSIVPGDVNAARYLAALNCRGGPNNNLCFNPFGSALINPALANSPEVIADFERVAVRTYLSSLATLDGVVAGKLAELPGGPLSLAVGGQYRRETLGFRADIEQQTGQLAFVFSGPNFDASRDFYAGFAELDAPITDWITLNGAGRYEHIGGGFGGTFNPKGSVRIEPTHGLVLRGSIGTSFRAPSLSQITSISTINTAVTDPLNPSAVPFFTIVRTVPGRSLEPEKSRAINLGVVVQPTSSLSFSLDFYSYRYTDLIVKQDAQAIINANPLDTRIDRLAGTGPIQSIAVSFENAQSVRIRGLDFAADYRTDLVGGRLFLTGRASYTASYKANVGHGPNEDLAGQRNYQNFAPPLPRWRGNVNARFETGPHQFSVTTTYIGPVRENYALLTDLNNGFKINEFITVDAQYSIKVDALQSEFNVGVTNLFDATPPPVKLTSVELSGFDRQLHDPRGTILYAGFKTRF